MIILFFVIWFSLIAAYLSARPFFRVIERYPVATIEPDNDVHITTIFGYPIKHRSPVLRKYNLPHRIGGLGGRPQVSTETVLKQVT